MMRTLMIVLFLASGSTLVGGELPIFNLPNLTGGESLTHKHVAGKKTVLQFWASWCQGCSVVMKNVGAIAKRQGTRFHTVSLDEAKSDSRNYFSDKKNLKKYMRLSYLDKDAKLAEALSIQALPAVIILDADGKVEGKFEGVISRKDYQKIRRLTKNER